MIGGKSPRDYLKQLQEHKQVGLNHSEMNSILESHEIAPEYLRHKDFEGFLTARQKILLKKIEIAMGKPTASFDEPAIHEYLEDEA